MNTGSAPSEFDLIRAIARHVSASADVPIGIGDDAAVISPSPSQHLVTTTDSLVLDRHFTSDWSARDIGHLAMAVNLSDLAAMAAKPRWALLNLTLPKNSPAATQGWLDDFMQGFLSVDDEVVLVGGNLSEGPLNIGVVLIGEVAPGQVVSRQGTYVGDALVVTGPLGDAAAALQLMAKNEPVKKALQAQLYRPTPRILAGQHAAKHVHAMIDVSDGLLADLSHLLNAPLTNGNSRNLGAEIQLDKLPTSQALSDLNWPPADRWNLQLSGGNDYELLMSVPPSKVDDLLADLQSVSTPASVIGQVISEPGVRLLDPHGDAFVPARLGWDHFQEARK